MDPTDRFCQPSGDVTIRFSLIFVAYCTSWLGLGWQKLAEAERFSDTWVNKTLGRSSAYNLVMVAQYVYGKVSTLKALKKAPPYKWVRQT